MKSDEIYIGMQVKVLIPESDYLSFHARQYSGLSAVIRRIYDYAFGHKLVPDVCEIEFESGEKLDINCMYLREIPYDASGLHLWLK